MSCNHTSDLLPQADRNLRKNISVACAHVRHTRYTYTSRHGALAPYRTLFHVLGSANIVKVLLDILRVESPVDVERPVSCP